MIASTTSAVLQDESSISTAQVIFFMIGALVGLVLFVLILKFCLRVEKESGRYAYSPIKIGMAAVSPLVFTVTSLLNIEIPLLIFVIAAVVLCLVILIWNIVTYRFFAGILFSVVHIVAGLLAGMSIAALVLVIVLLVLLFLFGGAGASAGGSGVPSRVRDVNNGMTYQVVTGANGEAYIEDNGRSCILRSSDYSGRYIDDYGNEYVAC